jgi:hypothetical protein
MSEPVIIIGAARSGTKFLRDTLGTSQDAMAIPYDISYVWRYRNESWPDDALAVEACTEAARSYIRRYILGQGGDCPVVLEKTVANCLRVPFVAKVFPEAKFIHLMRDGRDVVASSMRQWQSPVDWRYSLKKARQFPIRNFRYAAWYVGNRLRRLGTRSTRSVWGPRYPGIDDDVATKELAEVCAIQWAKCVDTATRDLQYVPVERVLSVRYEDLVSDESTWRELCEFCGLSDAQAVLVELEKTIRPDTIGKWRNALQPDELDKVLPIILPTLTQHGYAEQD